MLPKGSIPWMAIRDFNAILFESEKFGGRLNDNGCPIFGDFVHALTLQDIGFTGLKFTWKRGRDFERLDRAIGNDEWVKTFPNFPISHLPRIKSNHQPIFLSLRPGIYVPTGHLFQFLVGWTEHQEFSDCQRQMEF